MILSISGLQAKILLRIVFFFIAIIYAFCFWTTTIILLSYTVEELEIQDDCGMPVNYARIQALEEIIRKDIVSDKNSLHRAITPVLMLAHFFALLPVQGIKGQNTSYLT